MRRLGCVLYAGSQGWSLTARTGSGSTLIPCSTSLFDASRRHLLRPVGWRSFLYAPCRGCFASPGLRLYSWGGAREAAPPDQWTVPPDSLESAARSELITRSIIVLRSRSGISNGPAITAPSESSSARITPPPSNGFTIQLKPRRATGRSASASGLRARSIARSMSASSALTSVSVHARGSRPRDGMTCVLAWFSPRSQISTLMSTLATSYRFRLVPGRAEERARMRPPG